MQRRLIIRLNSQEIPTARIVCLWGPFRKPSGCELIHQLQVDEEDGTTLVHRMFNDAALAMIEDGAEGWVMPDEEAEGSGA